MVGVFQGLTFVVTISFFVMLPLAAITCVIWPTVQHGIDQCNTLSSLQAISVFGCTTS